MQLQALQGCASVLPRGPPMAVMVRGVQRVPPLPMMPARDSEGHLSHLQVAQQGTLAAPSGEEPALLGAKTQGATQWMCLHGRCVVAVVVETLVHGPPDSDTSRRTLTVTQGLRHTTTQAHEIKACLLLEEDDAWVSLGHAMQAKQSVCMPR